MAAAVEHCELHRRIALNAMRLIGVSPRRLALGVMVPTAFLSMWISNTATTAMMVCSMYTRLYLIVCFQRLFLTLFLVHIAQIFFFPDLKTV